MGSPLRGFAARVRRSMRVAVNRSLLLGMIQMGLLVWTTYNISRMRTSLPVDIEHGDIMQVVAGMALSIAAISCVLFFLIANSSFKLQFEMSVLRCKRRRFIVIMALTTLLPFPFGDYAICHIFAIFALDFWPPYPDPAASPIRARSRPLLASLVLSLLCSIVLTFYGALVTYRAFWSYRTIRGKAASIEILSRNAGIVLDDQHDESLVPRYYDLPSQQVEPDYWLSDRYFGYSKLRSATFNRRCFVAYWLLCRPVLLVLEVALSVPAAYNLSQVSSSLVGVWALGMVLMNAALLGSFALSRDLQRVQHHLIITPSQPTAPHMLTTYIVLLSSSVDICQMGVVLWELVIWFRIWPALGDAFSGDVYPISESSRHAWGMAVAVIMPMVGLAVAIVVSLDAILLKRMYMAYRRTQKSLAKVGYSMNGTAL